jgi:hypothetical protein
MDVMIQERPASVTPAIHGWAGLLDQVDGLSGRNLRESLPDLSARIQRAQASTKAIIRNFENGDEDLAYERLVELLHSVRVFFAVFSRDLDWADTPGAEIPREDYSSALERAIAQLVRAQKCRSWVSICDVLEFEIAPLLESWQDLAERTYAQGN